MQKEREDIYKEVEIENSAERERYIDIKRGRSRRQCSKKRERYRYIKR